MAGNGRRTKVRSRPAGRGGPRTPPEEATGREADFLFRWRESTTPVVVQLIDGTEHRGVIEYFDRDLIKLVPPSGPGLLLRKADIRYIGEGSGRPAPRRKRRPT
jgi:hypothetical protein